MIRHGQDQMSKSKGNLIAPEHYSDTVGADTLRLFHLFVGPPFDEVDWSEQTEQVIDEGAGNTSTGCGAPAPPSNTCGPESRRLSTCRCARPCTAPSPT